MTFLLPAGLALLALVPLLVLLYLMRSRRREVAVSTLLFWQRVLERTPQRRFLGKLRNPLSLLLLLLILLALAFAVARPEWPDFLRGGSVVVVVESGLGMTAQDASGSRFERALALAAPHIERASGGYQVAIIAAGRSPIVLTPFTTDPRSAKAALSSHVPGDDAADLDGAVALGRKLLESRGGEKRLVVFSNEKPQSAEGAEWSPVGGPAENFAITQLAARSVPASPQTQEILVETGNYSTTAGSVEVELRLDGELLDVLRMDVPAGGVMQQVISLDGQRVDGKPGLLEARLAGRDAIANDNTVRAVVTLPEPLRILLVSEGNPFLESYLRSDSAVQFEMLPPNAWKPALASGFDVVIFDAWVPPDPGIGNFFYLGRTPYESTDEALAQPLITATASGHPALRAAALERISVLNARAQSAPPGAEGVALASSGADTLLLAMDSGGHRTLAMGFLPQESDLPFRAAFPLFMSSALHWLAGRDEPAPHALAAGEALLLPPGSVVVEGEKEKNQPVFASTRSGFYLLRENGKDRWLAVQTGDPAASDLRNAGEQPGGAPASPSPGGWIAWTPWRWIALLALMLLTVEWLLFHRRLTE